MRFLSGHKSVTPTMILVEIDGITILVDCGAETSRGPVELPDEAYEVDAVLLTHGHVDHIAGFPALLASGFHAPVFGTRATLAISRIVFGDIIRLKGGQHRDVRAFLGGFDHVVRAKPYGESFKPLPNRDIEVTFHEAGHILGSSSIEIKSKSSRILFSGDLGRPGAPVLRDYNTEWDDSVPFDLVVMESTFGDCEHKRTRDQVTEDILKVVERARKDGGHILVPAAAIGRTQELIYHLDKLVEAERLKDLPVALDTPMGLRVTNVYENFKPLFDEESLDKLSRGDDPLDFKGLYAVRKTRDSRKLRELDESMLIISGSGMCTGGRIVDHMRDLLPYSETNVMFLGYQAPGTPGHAIIKAFEAGSEGPSETVKMGGVDVPVRASVDVINGLSAHADRKDLAAWLDRIPNVAKVALHHGDAEVQLAFAKWYNK